MSAVAVTVALGLAGCVAMSEHYVTFEARTERASGLSPKSAFSLLLDPNQPAAVQGMFQRTAAALRAAGLHVRAEGEGDFVIHMQVVYSAKTATESIRFNGSSGTMMRHETDISSVWRYLIFYAYDQRELARGEVKPVWGGQVVGDSRKLGADDATMVVELFRHLGQDLRTREKVTPTVR